MPYSRFSNKSRVIPSSGRVQGTVLTALAGLDMVTPMEMIKDGKTPYAKNFRLYDQSQGGREVAVSTRKGPGFYVEPLNEALKQSDTDTTGSQKIIASGNIYAERKAITFNGVITKLELHLQALNGTGPLRVDIHLDNAGKIGQKISESSFTTVPENGWATCRFLRGTEVTNTSYVWIVIYQQDDCTGTYGISTSATGSAQFSYSSLLGLTETTYGIPYKLYGCDKIKDKNVYRFNLDGGTNVTLVAFGTGLYKINESTHQYELVVGGLNANATEYSFTNGDGAVFWVNGYDQLKRWDGTTVETITDAELPILSQITFHKDRIMGVAASDPNKIAFSENPGNPSDLPANQQWYRQWLSVSIIYAPRPKNGSPVTGIISFQDALTILTQDSKYILSGSDRGNYYLRQSTGAKGALSRKGVTSDPNYIYFIADDGIYRFNGSRDEKISRAIQPLFDKCPRKQDITLAIWQNKLRVYMASEFSTVNDICVILDLDFEEWMLDTNTFINRALYYSDADDDMELVEFNSLTGAAYYAEQDFNSVGGPIDFDYRLKYNSFGTPAQRKKIKKFFPLIQGVGTTFKVKHGIDRDIQDEPRIKEQELVAGGNKLGTFALDGTAVLSGKVAFKPRKVSVSGNARTFQYRVSRNAVNNQVAFMGVQLTYKQKRL